MRILFSEKSDWAADLHESFHGSGHDIAFGPLTAAAVRRADLVVPLTIQAMLAMGDQPDLVSGNPIPIPARAITELCDDKARLNRVWAEKGFADWIPAMGVRDRYPYILKRSHDIWGRHSHILRSADDQHRYAKELADPAFFTQELVLGTQEYTTHMIRAKGQTPAVLTLQMTFASEAFVKGPEKPVARAVVDSVHLPLFNRMLDAIGFEGLCCFNFKERDGRPMVFELNPRMGGTLCRQFASFVAALGEQWKC